MIYWKLYDDLMDTFTPSLYSKMHVKYDQDVHDDKIKLLPPAYNIIRLRNVRSKTEASKTAEYIFLCVVYTSKKMSLKREVC